MESVHIPRRVYGEPEGQFPYLKMFGCLDRSHLSITTVIVFSMTSSSSSCHQHEFGFWIMNPEKNDDYFILNSLCGWQLSHSFPGCQTPFFISSRSFAPSHSKRNSSVDSENESKTEAHTRFAIQSRFQSLNGKLVRTHFSPKWTPKAYQDHTERLS